MRPAKKPLFRKVNTRTHGVRHGSGAKAKWERNTKASSRNEATLGPMHSTHRHGLDYTPLFRFLLSKVGENWDALHSEAVSRLDSEDPIYWIVARTEEEGQPYVRVGESSYYSGLFVDAQRRLSLVDPSLDEHSLKPFCPCCTHTFNGRRFTQTYGTPE